jgi:hypothetical protein
MTKRGQSQARHNRNRKVRRNLTVINPDAAGIDVGASVHYVAVPPERDEQPVRSFGAFTEDLHQLAQWLVQCGVRTVAMESTGVYWIPLYQILEDYGLKVKLVNARHVKHVPVSGCSSWKVSGSCRGHSVPRPRSASCAVICDNGRCSLAMPVAISNKCRRR